MLHVQVKVGPLGRILEAVKEGNERVVLESVQALVGALVQV